MRYVDQWVLSKSLEGVNAIIVGGLESCETKDISYEDILNRIAHKTKNLYSVPINLVMVYLITQ